MLDTKNPTPVKRGRYHAAVSQGFSRARISCVTYGEEKNNSEGLKEITVIEIIEPRCYFSDHFNGCCKYVCVQVLFLDIRMLFHSFVACSATQVSCCMSTGGDSFCTACSQRLLSTILLPSMNKVHQAHTCTFQ